MRIHLLALALTLLLSSSAMAGSHLWVVNEVFSNDDGTVQFIEMHVPMMAANEINLNGKWVLSVATSNQYDFTANLPVGSTAFAYLLLATQGFADLPNAPAPDHIIPANFFDLDADTIKYWNYVTGDLTFASGDLPLDGVTSLNRDGSTGVNSPTNFDGETGSVNAGTTAVADVHASSPTELFLRAHARSDFGAVEFVFQAPGDGPVDLSLVDVSGRVVRRLFDGPTPEAVTLVWDGANTTGVTVANGIYFARLIAGERSAVRKIAFLR